MPALDPRHDPTLDDLHGFFADGDVRARLRQTLDDDTRVRFELIVGADAHLFLVRRQLGRLVVDHEDLDRVDCTLRCTAADFRDLLTGALEPRRAFLDGRLRVTGNVGLVLALRRAMRR